MKSQAQAGKNATVLSLLCPQTKQIPFSCRAPSPPPLPVPVVLPPRSIENLADDNSMERTPRLFSITLASLPPAPDATLFLPDAGGAVSEEQDSQVHGRAVNESSRAGTDLGLSGRAGTQVHRVSGERRQGGAGRQDAVAEDHRHFIGRDVPQNVAAVDESGPTDTDRGLSSRAGTQVHGVLGGRRQGGAGRQEAHPVAEDQELNARAVPETQSVLAVEGGLGGLSE